MVTHAETRRSSRRALVVALALFVAWSVATWVFEGRIRTLLRPEATTDRLIYAVCVNLALGVVGGIALLRWWRGHGVVMRGTPGTQSRITTLTAVVAGFVLGLAAYVLQGAPSTDPVVMLNAFSQVFVVSAAEVIVCWCLVGAAVELALAERGRVLSIGAALLVAAALFGMYHFAHSPPFNKIAMVALLSGVGLVTGAFFFVSRDLAGTLVFHNFLGMFGVVQALAQQDRLETFSRLRPSLFATATLTAVVVAGGYWILYRTAVSNDV